MKPIKHADLSLFEHDPDERIIGEVTRHPIIIVFTILNAVFLIALFVGIVAFISRFEGQAVSSVGLDNVPSISKLVSVLMTILSLFVVIGSLIAIYVHFNNYLVLTDHKLVLVRSRNLFDRRVSQLSIGDIQDLTVEQKTLFSRLFNYGTINIETAGEQANFKFAYVPNPHEVAKAIVDAHEENLKLYGN